MITVKIRFILLFLFISIFSIYSQFYDLGQDPFLKKWQQINTPNYQIIFPEKFEDQAQRLANILDYSYSYVAASLHHKPHKISVIIHNKTFYSNGSVIWAPKRMEIFTTPPQDIYPTEWLEQLAIHESRHVVQIDKMNEGITHILSIIFGEQALGAVLGLVPRWFFEGDAVVTETALSKSGRGSLPSFDMHLRALELEGRKRYSYEKSVFGSYKNYIPSHYNYGYHMVAFGRINYTPKLWSTTLDYIARKPYTVYPLYFSLKKYVNSSKTELYNSTFDYFREAWITQLNKVEPTDYQVINYRNNDDYTTYKYPCFLNDSTLMVSTSGLSKYHSFVTINKEGQEKIKVKPGPGDDLTLSAANNTIVWEEYRPDARWENRSTSVIKVYNTQTRKKSTINYNSRLFSPAISQDGKTIAAVDVTSDNKCALVLFDAKSGTIKKHIFIPDNQQIQIPSWTNDGSAILFTFMDSGEKGIGSYQLKTDEFQTLLEPGFYDISHVTDGDNYYFYHASYSGIDNIYALSKDSGAIFQVTRSKYGAYYPRITASGKYLYYCDYTVNGFNVVRASVTPESWTPIRHIINQSPGIDNILREQEKGIINSDSIPMKKMEVRPYRRLPHLFNFHSWLPFYFDYNNYEITLDGYNIKPGLTLLSQNKLSTAFTRVGYAYYNSQHHIFTSFIYKGFIPILDIDAGYGGIPSVIPSEYTDSVKFSLENNQYYKLNIFIPIDISRGNYTTIIQPHVQLSKESKYYYDFERNKYLNQILFTQFSLSFYNFRNSLERDLYPRWGQVFLYNLSAAPFENRLIGNIQTFHTKLYFPGILMHHSFFLFAGVQKQMLDQYYFGSTFEFNRGYTSSPTFTEMFKASVDYAFPIVYPDYNIGRVLYLKRIYAQAFYDYVIYDHRNYSQYLKKYITQTNTTRSAGIEIISNIHLAHIIFPFNIGGRFSYLVDEKKGYIEFLFKLDSSIF